MRRSSLVLSLVVVYLFDWLVAVDVTTDPKTAVVGKKKREIVDKIVARVNGRNILLSHLKQPRIDKEAKRYSLQEAVDNELLFQKAASRKLLPTSLDIEKHITAWKEAHHLTDLDEKGFEERLRRDGLTGKMYRNQLGRILAIRNLRSTEISERVVITSREIEEYHQKNPEYSQDQYLLKTRLVPFSLASTPEEAIKKSHKVKWIDVDWIERSRLLDQMKFVADMKIGEISKPIKVAQGFQFVKLIKKEKSHQKKLTERWGDIEKLLQQQKMEKFEKEYVEGLKKKASIVYL
jgi:hypothetical protein